MATVKAIPDGLHTVTPQISIEGAAEAIDFLTNAFGAEEIVRAPDPSGKKIWHSMVRIGNSMLFLNDAAPEMGWPAHPQKLWLYSEDVDGMYKRAVAAGAKSNMEPADMFWGDRMARVTDRWNNEWSLAQHVKDLTREEMAKAQDEFVASMKKP